ncbi:flavodoxin [bacterium]|nr:flavodoxin [bacterium]
MIKTLVAYFSWSGNTKGIAEKIQEFSNSDIFRIETSKPYPKNYNDTAYGIAKEQHEQGIKPELKSNGDVSKYDVIFVGTPAWWYSMAPAVKTFLENNDFNGKKVVPFITHGGGGKYNIAQDMAAIAQGCELVEPPFVVYDSGEGSEKELQAWVKEVLAK